MVKFDVCLGGSYIPQLYPNKSRVLDSIAATAADLAVGDSAVWAAGGQMGARRIDPATDQVTQRIPVAEAQFGANPGANPGATSDIAVAVQAGAVWFVTTTDQLVRVDAGTNKVVRR